MGPRTADDESDRANLMVIGVSHGFQLVLLLIG